MIDYIYFICSSDSRMRSDKKKTINYKKSGEGIGPDDHNSEDN